MADQLISEIISEEAFAQVERLKGQLGDSVKLFEANVKSAVNFNSALKGSEGAKDLNNILQQQSKVMSDLAVSQNGVIQSHQKLMSIEKIAADLKAQYNGTTKEHIANMKDLAKAELDSARASQINQKAKSNEAKVQQEITNEYLMLNRALRDAEIRYKNLALTNNANTEAGKAAFKEFWALRNLLEGVDKSLGQYHRNVGNYGSAFRGLGNSMQQIFRELPSLAINANMFFLAISNNLPIFFDAVKVAKDEIKAANEVLKESAIVARAKAEADAIAAGASQKAAVAAGAQAEAQLLANMQATKAPSIWKLLGQSLFSYQTLLIAGVTILTLYGGKLVTWIGTLIKGKDALAFVKKEQEELTKAQESANKSAGEQIGKLTTLNSVLLSNAASAKEKKGAYDQLIKLYPSYADQLKDEYEKTGNVAMVIRNVLIPAIIAAANARAMQARIDALATKNLDTQIKQTEIGRKQNIAAAKEATALARAGGEPSLLDIEQGNVDLGLISARKEVKNLKTDWQELQTEVNNNTKAIQGYADSILKNQPKMGSLTADGVDAATSAANQKKEREKSDKDETESFIKNLELRAKAAIDFNKVLFDATGNEKYATVRKQLQEKLENDIYQIRISKAKLTATDRENIELEHNKRLDEIGAEFLSSIAEKNKKRIEEEKRFADEIKAISEKQVEDERNREFEEADRQIRAKIGYLEAVARSEDRANLAAYTSGKKSREQYEKDKLDIQNKYEEASYNSLLDYYFDQLKLAGSNIEDQQNIWAQIERLQKQHEDNKTKTAKEGEDERRKGIWGTVEASKNLFNEVLGLVSDLAQNEIDNLNKVIEGIEATAQKQKEAIEETSLSEEDKASRIKIIDAEVATQKESFAKKEKELKLKQAKFDRAQSIANAIQSTALGIARALKDFPYPYSAIVAALVGALGAVQITRVLATPIPQYKHGRKGGKAEIALVGEAGAERVEHADGSSYYVDKPTITYLPEHAKVIPNYELNRERLNKAAMSSVYVTQGGQMVDRSNNSKEVIAAIKEQTQAVKNNKTNIHINRSWKGDSVSIQRNFSYQKWIQDNI